MTAVNSHDIAAAAKLLNVPVELAGAMAYTYQESQGRYSADKREREARHVLWLRGEPRGYAPGGFTQSLLLTWQKADTGNRARLCVAFPILGDVFDVVQREGVDGLALWAGIGVTA